MFCIYIGLIVSVYTWGLLSNKKKFASAIRKLKIWRPWLKHCVLNRIILRSYQCCVDTYIAI